MYTYIFIGIIIYTYICMYLCICVYIYVYLFDMYVYVYIYTCTYIYIYIHVYIYMYIYIYIWIHTHVSIYIHMTCFTSKSGSSECVIFYPSVHIKWALIFELSWSFSDCTYNVYEVAKISGLPNSIGLFCKRALYKRLYSAKKKRVLCFQGAYQS